MPSFRRILAAATAVIGIAIFIAPPASAGSVTSGYACLPSNAGGRWTMEIIAPATATRGSTVTIDVNVTGTVNFDSPYPFEKPGGMTVTLGGASSGNVETTGATAPPIPAGQPFRLIGGHAQVTLPNAGDVTFRPASFYTVINISTGARHTCWITPGTTAAVAATTHVS